jgi:Fe-S cluster biogenesis protein NfuA
MTIVSPFDNAEGDDEDGSSETEAPTATATYTALPSDEEPLDLTWDNVDAVLEEMRPYLLQDGGNVAISEIDGPVVRLELQGECGTCPSSTQTMKMGLERKLKERIPEIQEVVQALPDTPDLTDDQINIVLDSVRPFLQVAGGSIEVASITGEGGIQPTIMLKMEGAAASLNSVKLEIAQRLQRHFMISGLRVDWA